MPIYFRGFAIDKNRWTLPSEFNLKADLIFKKNSDRR